MTPDDRIQVVVLVPTFGRPDMLARCLDSISRQDAFRDTRYRIEVVVGDNNPDASALTQVNARASAFPVPLSAMHVPEVGLCYNRNALAQAALDRRADLVALLDDDEVADPGWLAALLTGMKATGADAMIGPVTTIFHPDTPDWFRWSGIVHTSPRTAALGTGAPSPKLASHNTIFDAAILRDMDAPWFPLELNRLGSEDQAFFWRARALGHGEVLWCAEAKVSEELPAERANWRYFVTRGRQWGASMVIATNVVRQLHPKAAIAAPWRETVRQAARLVLGLPLMLTRKGRPRVYRQAVYVYGRILGHLGKTQAFYGG